MGSSDSDVDNGPPEDADILSDAGSIGSIDAEDERDNHNDESDDDFPGPAFNSDSGDECDDVDLFFEYVRSLLLMRILNSKQFCHIMYYAARAGEGITRLKPYGLSEKTRSGHYGRKVKKSWVCIRITICILWTWFVVGKRRWVGLS